MWTISENSFYLDRIVRGKKNNEGKEIICQDPEEIQCVSDDPILEEEGEGDEDNSSSSQQVQIVCNDFERTVCYDPKKVKSNMFRILKDDIVVVQPLKIIHSWNPNDDNRIVELSFDVASDVIDLGLVPELCPYDIQRRTIRNPEGKPYYDHWSDKYMKLEFDKDSGTPRLTIKWDKDCGYNFETIYLRWKIPSGFRIMDTIDRLMGYSFRSTAENIDIKCSNTMNQPQVEVVVGHVVPRLPDIGKMYLGLEHSTTLRKNGFVLKGLYDLMQDAIAEDKIVEMTEEDGQRNEEE